MVSLKIGSPTWPFILFLMYLPNEIFTLEHKNSKRFLERFLPTENQDYVRSRIPAIGSMIEDYKHQRGEYLEWQT